ncbi:MAG: ABC transporter substrate-binding protein, partial [Polaromonas sp.]
MKKLNLWCGALVMAALSHASQAQILIGQTAGFTGPVGAGVKETTDGAKLYLDAINAKGGVSGQQIELISLDDKFDPKQAADNARKLIEEQNVAAMFLTRGTPHTEAIIPLLEKYGVPLIGPSTGAMVLHQPVKKHVFNVRATYQREAEKAITHLHSMGITRIGIVYADDSFGADGVAGAQKGLTTAKLTPAVLEKFNRAKPDFAPIAPKVFQSNAQAIIMVASG